MTLVQEETLLDGKAPHGYFLEEGIASVVMTVANGDTVEVGIIGIDGVVGLPILLGTGTAPGRTFVQIAGSGFRINADILKEEFERPGELRRHLHRYMQLLAPFSGQAVAPALSTDGLATSKTSGDRGKSAKLEDHSTPSPQP